MTDRIDERGDVGIYWREEIPGEQSEVKKGDTEKMAEIGRLVTDLFTQLQSTQPKPPSHVGVVIIRKDLAQEEKKVDAVAHETLSTNPGEVASIESQKETVENRQQIEAMINSFHKQEQLLLDAITQERKALKIQEQLQFLQQFNQSAQTGVSIEDTKSKIAYYEKERQTILHKMKELELSLQVN